MKKKTCLEAMMDLSDMTDHFHEHLHDVQQKVKQIVEAYEDQEEEAMELKDKVAYLERLLKRIAAIADQPDDDLAVDPLNRILMLVCEADIGRCPKCGFFQCVC